MYRLNSVHLLSYRSPSMEQQVTDSMSITSADQEKLLLLNKNTELRRVNKEVRLHRCWYCALVCFADVGKDTAAYQNQRIWVLCEILLLRCQNDPPPLPHKSYDLALLPDFKEKRKMSVFFGCSSYLFAFQYELTL